MRTKLDSAVVWLAPLTLVVALGVLAWAQQPTRTTFDKNFGSYNYSTPIRDAKGETVGYESYSVYLGETIGSGALQVKHWQLDFTVSKSLCCPPSSQVQLTGFGPVPDESVTLGTPKGHKLALSVDINTLPDPTYPPDPWAFSRSKTWFPPTPEPDPTIDLNFGEIDLQWDWTNDLWNKTEGHSVLDFGKFIRHSQEFSGENAALVKGFLFGIEILPVLKGSPPGRIGQSNILTIEIPK